MVNREEDETGRPLIAPPGYLMIKPLSPATLRIVSDDTAGSRLEGVPYFGPQLVQPLVIREQESMTA